MNWLPQMQPVETWELHAVAGENRFVDWLKGAAKWVRKHFTNGGTDMGGNSAHVFSFRGGWGGNP